MTIEMVNYLLVVSCRRPSGSGSGPGDIRGSQVSRDVVLGMVDLRTFEEFEKGSGHCPYLSFEGKCRVPKWVSIRDLFRKMGL